MNIHVYYGAKHLLYNVVKSQMPKTLALMNVLYDIYLIPYATFIHFLFFWFQRPFANLRTFIVHLIVPISKNHGQNKLK
jgi:hypothetical protein